MANPLGKPLERLFARLTVLNGLLTTTDSLISTGKSQFEELVVSNSSNLSEAFFGSRLLLEDIADLPADGWQEFQPTVHSYNFRIDEIGRIAEEILEKINLFAFSQGYEAFETFLLDSVAYLYHSKSITADPSKVEKWLEDHLSLLSKDEWCSYVRYFYRGSNNSKLLRFLRKLAPQIKRVEECNTTCANLQNWFSVASQVRHAATHSSGVIKQDRWTRLAGEKQKVLKNSFPGKIVSSGYELHMDKNSASQNLQLLHNYAYAIHKELSKRYGYCPAYSASSAS